MTRQAEGVHYRTVYAVIKGDFYDGLGVCQFVCPTEDDAKRAVEAGLGNDYYGLPLMADGALPEKVTVYRARPGFSLGGIDINVDPEYPWDAPAGTEQLSDDTVWGVDRAGVEVMARQVFGDLPIRGSEGPA